MTRDVRDPVRELVVTSLEAWDQVWRRNQHLVSRLVAADQDLRVVFVEPPSDPFHAAGRRTRPRRGRGLRPGAPPGADTTSRSEFAGASSRLWLFQPTKWLPRRLDAWADARLTTATLRAISRAGLSRPLLWINDPSSADLLRRTGWPALYDITDDWLLADRSPREQERLAHNEEYLLRNCQHVVVCSPRLLATKHASRMTLIPNAVDAEAYLANVTRPADLPPGPVVLYVGTLHRDRLDVELCARLATLIKGAATFVLVGPVALDDADQTFLSRAGAVLLGPREHTTIPAYLKSAEVLVVPHVVTEFTDSLDPIKVYEYLAAGRPVVSTPVAGFRELEVDRVAVESAGAFVARTLATLDAPPTEPGDAGEVPSWDLRAKAMREVLAQLGESRP